MGASPRSLGACVKLLDTLVILGTLAIGCLCKIVGHSGHCLLVQNLNDMQIPIPSHAVALRFLLIGLIVLVPPHREANADSFSRGCITISSHWAYRYGPASLGGEYGFLLMRRCRGINFAQVLSSFDFRGINLHKY